MGTIENDNINQLIMAVSDWQDKYQSLFDDYHELEVDNKRLRSALEDLYSMASSPQWRNEPLYRICELVEKSLEQSDV